MKRSVIMLFVLVLLCSQVFAAGNSISDWNALLSARQGKPDTKYLQELWDYVSQQYEENGGLDRLRATEWCRISLTILALGGDPTAFGTVDGQTINLIADGTYNWKGDLSLQGSNALIYALLTLDAYDYETPAGANYDRERILTELLATQHEDGGFGLSAASPSDVDITAMALQALAPYQKEQRKAVDAALDYLSKAQGVRGDFESWDIISGESSAQVVLALCALGIDPRLDVRFCKTEGSAYDGLLQFQLPDGSFCHTLSDGKPNSLTTVQGGLALCALERMDAGLPWVLKFSGEPRPDWQRTNVLPWIAAGSMLLAVACLLIWRKKACKK